MAAIRSRAGLYVLSPYLGGRAYLSIQTIKPHVPLIKFRKGGIPDAKSAQAGSQPPSGGSGSKGPVIRPTIEDYQLPLKYRRVPMDEKEIDYINRGGPD